MCLARAACKDMRFDLRTNLSEAETVIRASVSMTSGGAMRAKMIAATMLVISIGALLACLFLDYVGFSPCIYCWILRCITATTILLSTLNLTVLQKQRLRLFSITLFVSLVGITFAGALVFEEIRLSVMFGRVVWQVLATSRFLFGLIYNTVMFRLSLAGVRIERVAN